MNIPKLDYIQLWFYNWLMLDKEMPLEAISELSYKEFLKLNKEFFDMQRQIIEGDEE